MHDDDGCDDDDDIDMMIKANTFEQQFEALKSSIENRKKRSFFIMIVLNLFKLSIYLFKNDTNNFAKFVNLKQFYLHFKYWTKYMSSCQCSNDENNLKIYVSSCLIN